MDHGASPGGLNAFSPSDMVGPSPVTSNGTDGTEIEDEPTEEIAESVSQPPSIASSADSPLTTVCSIT
jgi:hypothetical protein